ncbi:MAG: hypothetical protein HQL76_10525 [Magnetococcales bacterium]|nr:hypothetical protein [Magnetococcales bacterium]
MSLSSDFSRPPMWRVVVRSGWPLLLLVGALVVMFGPIWSHYLELGLDPYRFNGDARSYVVPALRFIDPELFPNSPDLDYIKWLSPIGYQAIYALSSHWMEPLLFSKMLGVGLFFLGLMAVGLASYRLSGWAGVWVSMALMLSSGPELSGMPRNFSIPLLALAVAALLYGRVILVAAVVLVAAMFYPPVAVLGGCMLFLWLIVWPASDRGDARTWSFKSRVLFLAATAFLCLVLEGKQWFGSEGYGPLLTAKYCDAYPESGPQGRLEVVSVCQPPPPLVETLANLSLATLTDLHRGDPWFYDLRVMAKWKLASLGISRDRFLVGMFLLVMLAGYGLNLVRDPTGRRLLILLAAGGVGYVFSQPFAPQFYYPLRYLEKTVSLFLLIALPATVAALAVWFGNRWNGSWLRRPFVRSTAVLLVGGACLLTLGGRGGQYGGIDKDLTGAAPLMNYLRTLPKDALIAGWPKGITESIPLLAHRSVLVNQETHWPFHKEFTDEMRARTYALMEAYLATTPEPLIALRERYGVMYLVVEPRILDKGKLKYFSPFIEFANQKKREGQSRGFEVIRQIPHAQTFSMKDVVVLDLRLLQGAPINLEGDRP